MLTFANAIIEEDMHMVQQWLRHGADVNQIDEYGFKPLIEAAIVDNMEISKLLLNNGADPNQQDMTGGTALQWAVENSNLYLCKLLLEHGANPNAYNFSGQPVLATAMLRHHLPLRKLLMKAGADPIFAQDYIHTKLLGHMFELMGQATIVSPTNQFVGVEFEGFILEVTLGLIADSVSQFQNHFAARQLRRYSGIAQLIVNVLQKSLQLIRYQQYRVDITKHQTKIDALLQEEPIVIPVGYEGHAITFIKYNDIWVKCDRREDSRLYDNIMFYRVRNTQNLTKDFIKHLIYDKQSHDFINHELDDMLGLEPITEVKVDAQISGNCSWANVEATIPALFFLVMMEYNKDPQAHAYYKTLALNFFQRWREWNKDRALDYCIQRFNEGDSIRKACMAETLAAILFQRCQQNTPTDRARTERIMQVFLNSKYEYILKNYLRVYYYQGLTEEGRQFSELLKEYGMKV